MITGDDVVPYKFGEKSSRVLVSTGFQDATFKAYNGYVSCFNSVTYRSQLLIIFAPLYRLGHYTIPEEMDEVCAWLTSKLGLGGRSP